MKDLVGVEVFDAVGGFAGAIPWLIDPSGALLGVSVSMFPGMPVGNFLLVGLGLFAIYGIGSLLVAYLLWVRHPWAWPLAIWGPSGFIVPWLVPPLVVFALLAVPSVRSYVTSEGAQGSSEAAPREDRGRDDA